MRKVKVVSLGGTIAMVKDEQGLAQPALDAKALVEAVPEISKAAEIDLEAWKRVPSPFLTPQDIVDLSRLIRNWAGEGYHGVVVTQGTDTLEETAYLLDLLVDAETAVVVTGAQRNPSLPSADGPVNILDSVLTAADPEAPNKGALVVFCSEIHAAREVVKTHTSRVDTFKSPELGPLGVVNNGRVMWLRNPVVKEKYRVHEIKVRVEVVVAGMGSDSVMIDSAVQLGADGIILQALGGGHVPPAMIPGIERAVKAGKPVVMTSRCHMGRLLTNTYGFEGSETHLRKLGVIFGDALPTSKARIKLMVLLAAGLGIEDIRREFEKHYYA